MKNTFQSYSKRLLVSLLLNIEMKREAEDMKVDNRLG